MRKCEYTKTVYLAKVKKKIPSHLRFGFVTNMYEYLDTIVRVEKYQNQYHSDFAWISYDDDDYWEWNKNWFVWVIPELEYKLEILR